MLNAKQFYQSFGAQPDNGEVLEFCNKQVFISGNWLYVVSLDYGQDPFKWLSANFDGIVFQTRSGYLAIVVMFDDPVKDETDKAIAVAMYLADVKH